MATPSNRTAVLEATVRLIATGGLQAVSHRAVEAAAGVSHGTTRYYFGSRKKIVDATLEYLAARDAGMADQARQAAVATSAPAGFDVDRVADLMVALVTGEQHYQLARYELMLEVARRPELRPSLVRWRMSFIARIEVMLTQLGAPNPDLAARWWVAALDGLLLDELCAGTLPFREHARPLIRAMLATAANIPSLSDLDGTSPS